MLETNIDDMKGEIYSYLTEKLLGVGVLDVYMTPIMMKKTRPANMLSVICKDKDREKIEEIIFKETTTFGIRSYEVDRSILERKMEVKKTIYGDILVKEGYYKGEKIKTSLEYEEGKKIAIKNKIPLKDVYEAIK